METFHKFVRDRSYQSGALNQNLAFNLRDDVPNALYGKLENRHRPYKCSYRPSKRILKNKTARFCICFFFFLCAVLNRG